MPTSAQLIVASTGGRCSRPWRGPGRRPTRCARVRGCEPAPLAAAPEPCTRSCRAARSRRPSCRVGTSEFPRRAPRRGRRGRARTPRRASAMVSPGPPAICTGEYREIGTLALGVLRSNGRSVLAQSWPSSSTSRRGTRTSAALAAPGAVPTAYRTPSRCDQVGDRRRGLVGRGPVLAVGRAVDRLRRSDRRRLPGDSGRGRQARTSRRPAS